MAVFKCKMCGGDLNIQEGITVCECEYCFTKQTIPSLDNEKKLNLFNRANRLRLNSEFDKAANIYESIIAEFPEEAEGYWGLVLCNYGIEYVDDPATARKIPTCHRAAFESVANDENYKLAIEYADIVSQKLYRDEAREIDRIMSEILNISKNEKPYDIFVCYKETDASGERTIDSVIAQDVYDALTDKGYRVFFSRISLEDKIGQQYEPYIFAALNSAKVMLAFGTKYEHFHAVWVKNEWSRFLKLMAKDKSKTLVPCYKDMDAYDMPDEFKALQAQDMGKVGAMQDLLRGIEKLLPVGAPVTKTVTTETSGTKEHEIAFNDGYYIGEAIAGQPNGYGTRVWKDNRRYEGMWKFGEMDGKGTFYHPNGNQITGEFKSGKPYNCTGLWYLENGSVSGTFVNGKLNGKCYFRFKTGDRYEGEYLNGNRHGRGVYYYANGEKLEGEFRNSQPFNCVGYMKYTSGEYRGEIVNNRIHGKGVFTFSNGKKIEGVFKDGNPYNCTGFYKYTHAEYYGSFVNGVREGNGTFIFVSGDYAGDKYSGEFRNDDFNGKGVYTHKNGDRYEGDHVNGVRQGQGVFYHKNGSKYIGEFRNGFPNGYGEFYNTDGTKWKGEFKDNQPWNGKGVWLRGNSVIIGKIKNGKSATLGSFRF